MSSIDYERRMSDNRVNDNDEGEGGKLEAETSFDIQLYIYDMSKGLAKGLSGMFLGKIAKRFCYLGIQFPDLMLMKSSFCT